jgi:DNA-binding response OmpR family regulator
MSATEAGPTRVNHAARLNDPIRVLLVAGDEADYWHTRDLLDAAPHARFTIDWVRDLQGGLARLAPAAFDVLLLEEALPDGDGMEIVRVAPGRGCDAPIIILTGRGSLDLDLLAMELGAADYLERTRVDAALLERTIRYALHRRQLARRLSRLAQQDELTGPPTARCSTTGSSGRSPGRGATSGSLPSWCSISMASRRSTTVSAMASATGC